MLVQGQRLNIHKSHMAIMKKTVSFYKKVKIKHFDFLGTSGVTDS